MTDTLSSNDAFGVDDPLAAIIHVPKTAGTSINSSLQSLKIQGMSHCEAFIGNSDLLKVAVGQCRWISGHVIYGRMRDALDSVTDRQKNFFATMRDPLKQVASHYNWLIEIYHRSAAFYNNHPENIRQISKKIRIADNSDPTVIIDILKSHPILFLNTQSRYILGDKSSAQEFGDFEIVERYARIGHEATVDILLSEIAGSDLRAISDNVSPYHFDKEVFKTPEMTAFLREHNGLDAKLYDVVRQRWPE